MVFRYLKQKIWGNDSTELQKQLDDSFYKVENDMNMIKNWLAHLSQRSIDIDDKHNVHAHEISLTKKDIDDIKQWLGYLHTHTGELKKHASETHDYLMKIDSQHRILLGRLERIEADMKKGQTGTPQGTFKGQTRDMKTEDKIQIVLEKPKVLQRAKQFIGFDKNSLTGAEVEVVNLLYHSDRPLSYDEIANRLGKKEKSIRNLIYEVRRKGIDVQDRPVGVKEKGFFLSKEAKLSVTGR